MKHTTLFKSLLASALVTASVTSMNAQGVIATIAGTSTGGYSGDGGVAIAAKFSMPSGVAVDAAGNVYIADRNNHRVRKVDAATGVVTTVAGNGAMGYGGMGGAALAATLEYPNSIFIDNAGNYYFSDNYADAAFRVTPAGLISNVCGHGSQGSDGDGGPGELARMQLPFGVCADNAGNIYIADNGNNRVRKIDGATGIVTTIAGGAYGFSGDGGPAISASFSGIDGITVDFNGNIYISDKGNNRIRRINSLGIVQTIAGTGVAAYSGDGGSALSATLRQPGGLYINPVTGNLFICDYGNNVVRVIDVNGTNTIHTLAGNGVMGYGGDGGIATAALLNGPSGVWQDNAGSIYIADANNNRVRKVTGSGYKATGTNLLQQDEVRVFPNPSNGTFNVELGAAPVNASLEVYNVLGTKVYTQSIGQQSTTFSLSQPAGIYTLMLRSGAGVTVQKITVQK